MELTWKVDMSERVRHELDDAQVEQLRALLRGSWYTRSFRSVITYRAPLEVERYYHYLISISDGERHVRFDFVSGGRVLRGGEYNSWLRIRNPNWETELQQILAM